jgi:beta-glucosidase-like glycosyl hydrolase
MHRPGARRTLPVVLCALASALLPACAPTGSGPATGTAASTTTTRSATAAPSATTAGPTGEETAVAAALGHLDRRDEVLQLFVAGVPVDDLARGAPLVREGVGGLFLAGRSAASADALAGTVRQWQAAAPGPGLWVAADQEGGAVQMLTGPGLPRLPSARTQGRLPAGELTRLADELGASLAAAGVNLDLAPVADIVPAGTEAANAPIGAHDRQYGATAAEVVPAVRTVVDGLARHGVTATLKHFPGLGRVRGNTDVAADVRDTVTTADDDQVTAFATLADSAAHPFVMASTATYTRIDATRPAAFSRAVLTGVLRERHGFDGVLISDDVGNAAAVADIPPGERAVRFIAAGGTLVLTVDPDLVTEMVEAVLHRDRQDPAFRRAVDDAVRTALVAKARAGLLR